MRLVTRRGRSSTPSGSMRVLAALTVRERPQPRSRHAPPAGGAASDGREEGRGEVALRARHDALRPEGVGRSARRVPRVARGVSDALEHPERGHLSPQLEPLRRGARHVRGAREGVPVAVAADEARSRRRSPSSSSSSARSRSARRRAARRSRSTGASAARRPPLPLRVAAGTHVLARLQGGFAPVEKRVEVGGQARPSSSTRSSRRCSQSGRLSVTEDGGKGAEVLVDNVVVGKTPWQGSSRRASTSCSCAARATSARSPRTRRCASTRSRRSSSRSRRSTARCVSSPRRAAHRSRSTASSSATGSGTDTSARAGTRIEVAQNGFLPQARALDSRRAAHERIAVQLERDPDSPLWQAQKKPRIFAELARQLPARALPRRRRERQRLGVVPARRRRAARTSATSCRRVSASRSPPDTCILHVMSTIARPSFARSASRTAPGTASDKLSLKGLLVGGAAQLHRNTFGEKIPLLLPRRRRRAARERDRSPLRRVHARRRHATFRSTPRRPPSTSRTSTSRPRLRVGYRLSERLEVSAGVEVMVLVALEGSALGLHERRRPRQSGPRRVRQPDALRQHAAPRESRVGARFDF